MVKNTKAHHSFTRSSYDECELRKKITESKAPFEWRTDSNVVESKEVCFQASSPFMQNPFNSIPQDSVDIESELKGQTRNLSRCPEFKFDPTKFKPINIKLNECKDNRLVPEYTRENRSCNVLSGISINRFNPLCDDLLINIHHNDFIGRNTRLELKDTHTKKRDIETKKVRDHDIEHLDKFCQVGRLHCSFVDLKKRN